MCPFIGYGSTCQPRHYHQSPITVYPICLGDAAVIYYKIHVRDLQYKISWQLQFRYTKCVLHTVCVSKMLSHFNFFIQCCIILYWAIEYLNAKLLTIQEKTSMVSGLLTTLTILILCLVPCYSYALLHCFNSSSHDPGNVYKDKIQTLTSKYWFCCSPSVQDEPSQKVTTLPVKWAGASY